MWNYRVIKENIEGEIFYSVCEVFYYDNGSIHGWTEAVTLKDWETVEDLLGTVVMVKNDIMRFPILSLVDGKLLEEDSQMDKDAYELLGGKDELGGPAKVRDQK